MKYSSFGEGCWLRGVEESAGLELLSRMGQSGEVGEWPVLAPPCFLVAISLRPCEKLVCPAPGEGHRSRDPRSDCHQTA